MSIDFAYHLPLYAQVESMIIARISDGSLAPGARLPSEDSLVEEYAVSRTTIRAAIQSLIQRGLVEIRRGKGTFVTLPKITQELTELTGFVEDMQTLGRNATAKVLDSKSLRPTRQWPVSSPYPQARRSCESSASAWRTACRSLSTRLFCRRNWERK